MEMMLEVIVVDRKGEKVERMKEEREEVE